ncbi:MAG: hypothetical protein AB7K24_19750 [Gemmataceae bacterium]
MPSTIRLGGYTLVALALSTLPAFAAKYEIKVTDTAPPKELKEAFTKQLAPQALTLVNDKGETLCEVWLRKEFAAKATPEQIEKGLNYRALPEGSFVGVFRNPKLFYDYRQQKIKPGVYTMRLGFQPADGNHMGTALYNEFCLLLPALQDENPDPVKQKEMFQKSNKAAGTGHPAILMLFPNNKPADKPEIKSKGEGHYALFAKSDAMVDSKKVSIGFAITLVGHAAE